MNVMLSKMFHCRALLAFGVLALVGLWACADEKKDDKEKSALSGSWVKKEGELKIEFADKETLKIAPHGDPEMLLIQCSYSVEKGEVKAKVTGYEGKEEVKEKVKEKLPVGTSFSFKWKADGDTANLDEVKGDQADLLKSHLEGKYEKK
jgi:hypothetical protein